MNTLRTLLKGTLTTVGILLVLIAALALLAATQTHRVAGPGLSAALSHALDVPARISDVNLHPLQGTVELIDVSLGNPPDFGEGPAISLGKITAEFDLGTILSRTPTIRTLTLHDTKLDIRHEWGHGVNLLILTQRARKSGEKTDPQPETASPHPSTDANVKRGLIIQKIIGNGAHVNLTSNLARGGKAEVQVDPFSFDGTEGKAANVAQITAILLENILRTAAGSKGLLKPLAALIGE